MKYKDAGAIASVDLAAAATSVRHALEDLCGAGVRTLHARCVMFSCVRTLILLIVCSGSNVLATSVRASCRERNDVMKLFSSELQLTCNTGLPDEFEHFVARNYRCQGYNIHSEASSYASRRGMW